MLFLSLLGSLGDSLGEPSFMFPMDRTHDASACFFLIIICFLWIGAQLPQEIFISSGRILTLLYYFIILSISTKINISWGRLLRAGVIEHLSARYQLSRWYGHGGALVFGALPAGPLLNFTAWARPGGNGICPATQGWLSGEFGVAGQMPKTRSLHQSYQCLVLLPYRRFHGIKETQLPGNKSNHNHIYNAWNESASEMTLSPWSRCSVSVVAIL